MWRQRGQRPWPARPLVPFQTPDLDESYRPSAPQAAAPAFQPAFQPAAAPPFQYQGRYAPEAGAPEFQPSAAQLRARYAPEIGFRAAFKPSAAPPYAPRFRVAAPAFQPPAFEYQARSATEEEFRAAAPSFQPPAFEYQARSATEGFRAATPAFQPPAFEYQARSATEEEFRAAAPSFQPPAFENQARSATEGFRAAAPAFQPPPLEYQARSATEEGFRAAAPAFQPSAAPPFQYRAAEEGFRQSAAPPFQYLAWQGALDRASEQTLVEQYFPGHVSKWRRFVAEAEQGGYQLQESFGLGPDSIRGRFIFVEDKDRGCMEAVPAEVDDTVKMWKWLKSMHLEEVRNWKQTWQLLAEPATPVELPPSFVFHVRLRQQLEQLLVPSQYREQGFTGTGIAKSALVTVKVEDCPEVVYWTEQVVNRGVPTMISTIDELLQPLRPLVANFRYLHFLLVDARHQSLDAVLKMRRSRKKDQNDLEVPYHRLLLCFCKAAASGQPEVNFFGEVHEGKAREDICLQVNGISQPSEVKASYQTALPGDAASGIDRNKPAFAKMLKCNTKDPQPWHFGFFAERIERLWFALFEYTEDGNVKSIRVAPEFPCSRKWINMNRLFDIGELEKQTVGNTLRDAAPVRSSPGFKLLVRYVDTLCHRMGIPLSEIELIRDEIGDSLDLSGATVVGQGFKSLVLRTGDNVAKVSGENLINHEQAIHAVVDGVQFIRPMVAGQYGCVEGAGEGLRWLALRGFGRELIPADVTTKYEELWEFGEAAVHGIHKKGVLHRDIKPSNFLIVAGVLELNDFDVSCFTNDPATILCQRVGTPHFESPFRGSNQKYQYRDDWCSLVLTFLSLQWFYTTGTNKEADMMRAQESTNVPAKVKDCIRWIFSVAAAQGGLRPIS